MPKHLHGADIDFASGLTVVEQFNQLFVLFFAERSFCSSFGHGFSRFSSSREHHHLVFSVQFRVANQLFISEKKHDRNEKVLDCNTLQYILNENAYSKHVQ